LWSCGPAYAAGQAVGVEDIRNQDSAKFPGRAAICAPEDAAAQLWGCNGETI